MKKERKRAREKAKDAIDAKKTRDEQGNGEERRSEYVRRLEKEILEKRVEAANKVQRLLDVLQDEGGDQSLTMTTMHSLRKSFASLEAYFISDGTEDEEGKGVREWLLKKLREYYQTMATMVLEYDGDLVAKIALAVLCACGARWNQFREALQTVVEKALLGYDDAKCRRARDLFTSCFVNRFADVRLALLEMMATVMKKRKHSEHGDSEKNIILSSLSMLEQIVISSSPSAEIQLLENENSFAFRKGASNLDGKTTYFKQERRMFSECWTILLGMKLPEESYDRILSLLPEKVIPVMAQPLRLSDFLLKTYNRGGVHALLSLDSLWLLIMKHKLDYPFFYEKLYALLTPDAFLVRDRQRFMTLIPKFLTSNYLPGYLVAAFAKRLLRRALTAPPQGALWSMRVVLSLIHKHPSTAVLVHKPKDASAVEAVNFFDIKKDDEEEKITGASAGKDVFDDSETDPRKSNADQSSLWELESLRLHYCPAVAKMVNYFHEDFRTSKKSSALTGAIEDYAGIGYADLIEAELKRKAKECPLAYAPPSDALEPTFIKSSMLRW